MKQDTEQTSHTVLQPLAPGSAVWTDGLWKERFDTCATGTVPQLQHMFESKDISHVVENFKICAGEAEGEFAGTVFGDGDFYKWMEAAVCTAAHTGNEALLAQLEAYIDLIGRAQQPDGYLSTKQIIGERSANGAGRMGDINDFEVYNFGHLFTAACVYKQVTGKENFLKIAVKTADYLEQLYEKAAAADEVQTAVCPSHYMGLMDLYRTTGQARYLALAKRAIGLRASVKDGLDDNQDRLPLEEHDAIIGHAVRANYLYAGVADVCAEEDNETWRGVLDKVWSSLTEKKLYLTGGCGALYNGASPYGNFFNHQLVHQAYGYEYQLPNITAYNETCASVGGVLWAWRMFRLAQNAAYFDVLERMMLNTNLASVSLDGKRFFYENLLRRPKQMDFELVWPLTRSEYILSYCCPPNIARLVAQSAGYAYATGEDTVWTGMYGASRASVRLANGAAFTLVQTTDYPWDGTIQFACEDVTGDVPFTLQVRIPGWAEEAVLCVNGKEEALDAAAAGTYRAVQLRHPASDVVTLRITLRPRYTIAHGMVEEDAGQLALEYGPLVYCSESADTDVEALEDILLDLSAQYKPVWMEIEGRRVLSLEGEAYCQKRAQYSRDALYQTLHYAGLERASLRFVPYYVWDNRGPGEMRIWFPAAYR